MCVGLVDDVGASCQLCEQAIYLMLSKWKGNLLHYIPSTHPFKHTQARTGGVKGPEVDAEVGRVEVAELLQQRQLSRLGALPVIGVCVLFLWWEGVCMDVCVLV